MRMTLHYFINKKSFVYLMLLIFFYHTKMSSVCGLFMQSFIWVFNLSLFMQFAVFSYPLFFLIMILCFFIHVRATDEPECPDAAHSLGFVLSLNEVKGTVAVQKMLCVLCDLKTIYFLFYRT
jgi:hypothetical protein